jgi:predicted AAA+ superfamily ATPase
MYSRTLNLSELLKKKSFFLFGPRATGKTTLIEQQLDNARVYDLLDAEIFHKLLQRPKLIEEECSDAQQLVVIDEVQKFPQLLDEVHRLIHKHDMRFLLTGSSARKLKHGGANLLAGRAWEANLFPLTYREIPDFNLLRYLNDGGLPHVYPSSDSIEELESYVSTYLREEIQAEALTRNIAAFARFLDVIALANGQEINYENLASDCAVSTSTLKNYVQILEDTLLGMKLPGYTKTKKRKAISRAKHYLFDLGVTNILCKRPEIKLGSELFGNAFEHFIILEVRAFNKYFRRRQTLSYWRSTSKQEVDLIVGDDIAIEIKASTLVQDRHLRGIRCLKEENIFKRYIVVSNDTTIRKTQDGVEILPWEEFLKDLWNEKIF